MTDYGHPLMFGSFITPTNSDPDRPVALAQLSEAAGLDLVTFQDHPYQAGFLDTWTLLSYVAARTETVHLAGNVLNLPLRPPAVLARSVASLDLLSGGRVELGLGAGAFWDGIAAMGGERLTPGEGVTALEEGIDIIRGVWETTSPGPLRVGGDHHRVDGARRGPEPAHDIGIWLGAYKPRMLRLVGRKADGWLPSMSYLESLADLTEGNARIDDAATGAGRSPADIRRILNIGPDLSAEQIAQIALDHGFSGFILGSDDPGTLQRFGAEIAPEARERVAAERGGTVRPAFERPAITVRGVRRLSSPDPTAELSDMIDLAAVPDRLRDRVITPRDAGYADVRSGYMYTGRPGAVIMARDVDDVVSAVRFAAGQPAPFAVRSGGHGMGVEVRPGGILLDVSGLDSIEIVDDSTRRVRIGAGATWGHVAAALAERGWAMTTGNFGDTGVGGLGTSGGLGYMVRRYGMTVDHIVAADLVLADGTMVRADPDEHPDLFWAVRGGAGHIGVVTALELEAIDLGSGDVVYGEFLYDATDTGGFLRSWSDTMRDAPRELTTFVSMQRGRGTQPPIAQLQAIWAGDDVDAASAGLTPLLSLAPVLRQQAQVVPYAALVPPLDQRHVGQQTIRMRNGYVREMDDATVDALEALLADAAVARLELRSVGGAVNDVPADAMAFSHRDAEVFAAAWMLPGRERLVDAAWARMRPHVDGLYIGYTTETGPQVTREAYRSNFDRLAGIKDRYDPHGLFRGL